MNIRQLEYFMLTAECRNVTEAAERLHMAQPPLSRALKNLEEELGVTLFSRSNRGVRLTDAGRLLYDEAKPLFRQMHQNRRMLFNASYCHTKNEHISGAAPCLHLLHAPRNNQRIGNMAA